MSIFFLLLNIIYFIKTKANIGCDDISTISDQYKTLEECRTYEVKEGDNCCVGVYSIMGKNTYFCQSFSKSATEDDISIEMDKIVKEKENKYLGAVVKAKASCINDITPFIGTNCNIYDSQNSEKFGNCSNFKKEKNDDYCCLFTGNVMFDNIKTEVQFCHEVNQTQTSDMNNVATNIDSKSEMYGVKYINCSPEIPIQPPKRDSNFIKNINFFFIFFLLSLLI